MATKKPHPSRPISDRKHFQALKPFMQKVSIGSIRRPFFSLCVKASIAKCFEFNVAVRKKREFDDAFFWMPALRGICEDLIVLNFVKDMPHADREQLIRSLMSHDVHSRAKSQEVFFSQTRAHQPVLRIKDVSTKLATIESNAQRIWNAHGWPGLQHGTMPQIRQIAERQGQPVLASLYDYLYRLTSAAVHFNVQSLLRSGWGPSKANFTFSTKNFQIYYASYTRVYGSFLFCVYFEFFGKFLKPGPKVTRIVNEIRKELLLEQRWPEMVTFEEMNLKPPEPNILMQTLFLVMESEKRKRLIS